MSVIYIILGFVTLIVILALIAPKHFDVSRSIIINRSRNEVYEYLKMINNQDHWSPWKKKDPNMKQSTVGADGEIGFISKWEGNKDVGVGEQELTKLVENEEVLTHIRFFKPWKSEADGYFRMKDSEDGNTEVTWGFSGNIKFRGISSCYS